MSVTATMAMFSLPGNSASKGQMSDRYTKYCEGEFFKDTCKIFQD